MTEQPSRRSFLLRTGALALGPAAAASVGELASLLAAAPTGGEDYWGMVRRQFAFPDNKVPMNAANLCPSPRVVAEQVAELTRDIDRDCSFHNRAKFEPLKRYKVAATETWAQPTISGSRVFVKDVSSLTLWTMK